MTAFDSSLISYQPPQSATAKIPNNPLFTLVPPQLNDETQLQLPSTIPASRADVVNLEQKLQAQLKYQQARPTGLCPIRFELVKQTLDEIIRQSYVECAERGLMLARVRDEAYKTVAAYQTLYIEALNDNAAQELENEQSVNQQKELIMRLEEENQHIRRQLAEVQSQLTRTEQREITRRSQEERKYAEEQVFLQRQKAQLQSILDNRNAQ